MKELNLNHWFKRLFTPTFASIRREPNTFIFHYIVYKATTEILTINPMVRQDKGCKIYSN